MIIIVDGMGGDNAPVEIVKGCVAAVNKNTGFDIVLTGDRDALRKELDNHTYDKSRIQIHHTTQVISNEESPVKALKEKKDSSMVVGLNLLKEGKGDAFLSAGCTGALMAGSLLIVKPIKGVDRPALAPVIPTLKGKALLIDGGSNAVCKPINLLQFGMMGSIYAKNVMGAQNPAVGLVNIGEEASKGNELYKQSFALLSSASSLNFKGNIEGREIPQGAVDVVVCDGFVGNVVLKFMEGMAKTVFELLKEEFNKNILTKFGTLLLSKGLKSFKKKTDYNEYGGAPLLGINGVVIKCHGSTRAKTVGIAIDQAVRFVESQAVEQMKNDFINMEDKNVDSAK